MLLPYSTSNARRSTFWGLLWVAVLGPATFVMFGFVGQAELALWSLLSGAAAITLLYVWCAVYVREEPRLIRIVLIYGAGLFLLLTVAVGWAIARPSIRDTKQMRVQADIQGIRTMLLSFSGTHGDYPSTDQGLHALVPKLMEELPKDAWGTPYVYRQPGKRYPNAYDLFSAGPDRMADTADDEWGK
jgi:general secretion pathway protein G